MQTTTFTMENENEATALVSYFDTCGFPTTRKGNVVKVKGDGKLVGYLYEKFVTIALI